MDTKQPNAKMSRRGAVPAIVTAALLGEYSLLIMPFILTAMMQGYQLSEIDGASMVSAQLVAMGVGGIAVSRLLLRSRPKQIVVIAAVAIVAANAVCALGANSILLATARVLTGLAEGSLMAAAGALAAGEENSHRIFAILGFVIAVVAAVALYLTPLLFQYFGARSVFWLLSASPLAAIAVSPWLPASEAAGRSSVQHTGALGIKGAKPVLFAFALLWVGAGALWVFAERIGTAQGLTLEQVGSFLAIGQIIGIVGPTIAARCANEGTLQLCIAVGSVLMAVGGLWLVYGGSHFSYIAAAALLSIGSMFLAPLFRTLMARLDTVGSVVALSVAFYTFAFGAAPLLVSWLEAAGGGYRALAWLAAIAFAASGLLAFSVRSRSPSLRTPHAVH